jgi:ribosomal-protein-alanine N-acetyltransferase
MRLGDVAEVGRIERRVFGREAWPSSAFAFLVEVFAATRPPRGRLWVAVERDSRVVGYTGIELSALGGEADIVNLAVDPARRRHGIGRRLLTAVTTYCRARRVPILWLRVRRSNRSARVFYRRCGFRVAGRFAGYYDHPREPATLMTLDL